MSISFEDLHIWFGFVYLHPTTNKIQNVMENENNTYLGKAMIQMMVATILLICAVSHTSMTWTIILGVAGMVWAAYAHNNFNEYERRG